MNLIRLLIIIFLLWMAWRFVQAWLDSNRQRVARKKPAPQLSEKVVPCALCGLHVPEGEALQAGDRHYCSEAHRDAGR